MRQTHERPVPTPSHSRHLPAPQSQLLHAAKIPNYSMALTYSMIYYTKPKLC